MSGLVWSAKAIPGQYVHQDKMSVKKSAKSGQYVHKDNLSQDEMSQDEMSQDKTSQDKMSVRTKRLLASCLCTYGRPPRHQPWPRH